MLFALTVAYLLCLDLFLFGAIFSRRQFLEDFELPTSGRSEEGVVLLCQSSCFVSLCLPCTSHSLFVIFLKLPTLTGFSHDQSKT